MNTTDRLAAIEEGITSGLSLRAVARSLGISDKTVRNLLRTADSGAPAAVATAQDYAVERPPKRVLPPVEMDGALGVLPVSPTREFIRCTCSHAAWRVPGLDEWECGCPLKQCHGPRQVADEHGTPQIVYGPYRIRPFPAPPPDAA